MRLAVVALVACTQHPASSPPGERRDFPRELAAALHDEHALANLFAPGMHAELIGERDVADGPQLAHLIATSPIEIGRVWTSGDRAVIELLLASEIGAAVVELDRDGRATAVRVYVDMVATTARRDASWLPKGMRIRPAARLPYHTRTDARHTADEARHLAAANRVWAGMDAHDPDAVLASARADYVYDDYSAPAPIDRADTLALLRGFLGAVQGFHIAKRPVQFAAGDDVITEMVEMMSVQGKVVELHSLDVKRFVGDDVIDDWQYANGAEVLRQMFRIKVPR